MRSNTQQYVSYIEYMIDIKNKFIYPHLEKNLWKTSWEEVEKYLQKEIGTDTSIKFKSTDRDFIKI